MKCTPVYFGGGGGGNAPARKRSARLRLEALEDRCVPAVFTVTTPDDDAGTPGTFRWAINQANNTAGYDEIRFNVNGVAGLAPEYIEVMAVNGPLPAITEEVLIDGFTQAGGNHWAWIVLDGDYLTGSGLRLNAGNVTVRGLVVDNFNGNGIEINTGPAHTPLAMV